MEESLKLIEDVKSIKAKLEEDISYLIYKFHQDTDLYIEDVIISTDPDGNIDNVEAKIMNPF